MRPPSRGPSVIALTKMAAAAAASQFSAQVSSLNNYNDLYPDWTQREVSTGVRHLQIHIYSKKNCHLIEKRVSETREMS